LAFHRSHRWGGALTLAAALGLGPAAARAQAPASPEAPKVVDLDTPVAASLAKPAPAQADRTAFTRAQVLHKPTGDEVHPLFPKRALETGRRGKAQVVCEIAASTRLENCVVTAEDPPGFGFGEATLQAAALFRVKPPSYQGEPVPHAKFTIPMTFEIAPPPLKTLEDREAARATGELPPAAAKPEPPRETAAERLKRLGPLRRSDDVLWAPLALAGYALAGLAWALFAPLQTRRRKPRRIPGHLA